MSEGLATVADMSTDPASPRWCRAPATSAERRADVLGAAGLFVLSILSWVLGSATGLYGTRAPEAWLSLLVLGAIVLPLCVRRRWPSAVAIVVAVAFVVAGELRVPEGVVSNVALFCAIYTVGAWEGNRRRAGWVRAAIFAVMGVWMLISYFHSSTIDPEDLGLDGLGQNEPIGAVALTPLAAYLMQHALINVLYFAGAAWFGNHAWSAARQRATLEHRTEELAAEKGRAARRAVTIERLRIARELHDAVAHHVSLMGVQAAAARTLLPRDPGAATTQLTAVEESARRAVGELYALLGTLREEEDDGAAPARGSGSPEHGSGPGAGRRPDEATATLGVGVLPHLVAEARGAGLLVELVTVGEPVPLPPLIDLNLYRIAQEALTNVVKHAGTGTRARVHLRYLGAPLVPGSTAVELEVTDDGRGRPGPRAIGGGLGLAGMRERVAAMRGSLVADYRSTGGFIVRVAIPLGVPDTPDLLLGPPSPGAIEVTMAASAVGHDHGAGAR